MATAVVAFRFVVLGGTIVVAAPSAPKVCGH